MDFCLSLELENVFVRIAGMKYFESFLSIRALFSIGWSIIVDRTDRQIVDRTDNNLNLTFVRKNIQPA